MAHSEVDNFVFYKSQCSSNQCIYLVVYVDDVVIIEDFKQHLVVSLSFLKKESRIVLVISLN